MKLVFIDPKCPTPYDSERLASRGLGGTEATIVRIARALSTTSDVTVVQHNRTISAVESSSLRFLPTSDLEVTVRDADHVIFIQKAQFIGAVAASSKARMWIWLHNFIEDEVPLFWQDHIRHRLGIICVSRTHLQHTVNRMRQHWLYRLTGGWPARGGILFQHNPIDENLLPDPGVTRDPFKLVFFSSPHKGLEQVISSFAEAHRRESRLRLYIADPGYLSNQKAALLEHPGIVRLGTLPQAEVLRHVREALCVFYPQRKRPETFGLVYAEANAVGTPVLAHHFGAAAEVLAPQNPPIDADNQEIVMATLSQWLGGAVPRVAAVSAFRISRVAEDWRQFFYSPDKFIRAQADATSHGSGHGS